MIITLSLFYSVIKHWTAKQYEIKIFKLSFFSLLLNMSCWTFKINKITFFFSNYCYFFYKISKIKKFSLCCIVLYIYIILLYYCITVFSNPNKQTDTDDYLKTKLKNYLKTIFWTENLFSIYRAVTQITFKRMTHCSIVYFS